MLITRTSRFSGNTNTLDLDITEEQLQRWKNGELVQTVFPHLSPSEREFIITGMTEEEWNEIFNED